MSRQKKKSKEPLEIKNYPSKTVFVVVTDKDSPLFGIFSSLKKARRGVAQWRLDELKIKYDIQSILVDYRLTDRPIKYYVGDKRDAESNNEKADNDSTG